jgi:hypothetical protein
MSRFWADTMPAVTVPPRPNGLPTASTQSPIRAFWGASFTYGKSEPSALSRARSVFASVPITLASRVRPSSVTICTSEPLSTTWLLVTR